MKCAKITNKKAMHVQIEWGQESFGESDERKTKHKFLITKWNTKTATRGLGGNL